MSKVLIICDSNWADEMDLDGFKVMEKQKWESHKEKVKAWFSVKEEAENKRVEEEKAKKGYGWHREIASIGVGTNEDVHYTSYEDWLSQFKEQSITDEEAEVIIRLFNLSFTFNGKTTIRDFGYFLDEPRDNYQDEEY